MQFCKSCGAQLDDDAKFCRECGAQIVSDAPVNKDNITEVEAEAVYTPLNNNTEGYYNAQSTTTEESQTTGSNEQNKSPLGLISMILSIVAVASCCTMFPAGIAAIILSIIGLKKGNTDRTKAKVGLILGIISVAVYFIFAFAVLLSFDSDPNLFENIFSDFAQVQY